MSTMVIGQVVNQAAKRPWLRNLIIGTCLLGSLAGPLVLVTVLAGAFGGAAANAANAPAQLPGVPGVALQAYTAAVAQVTAYSPHCTGLSWADLAGIAQVESTQAADHTVDADGTVSPPIWGILLDGKNGASLVWETDDGALDGESTYARAMGPFQILSSTWESEWETIAKGGTGNPQNFFDASLVAAVYLCGDGRNLADPAQLSAAIFQYNHSEQYVQQVLSWITTYTALGQLNPGQASGTAGIVIAAAERELGQPYSYGGGNAAGPTLGTCDAAVGGGYLNGKCLGTTTVGFDCSGLALYAFAQAGITLPRVAQDQYDHAPVKLPASAGLSDLQPGDLVFFAYNPADPDAYDGNVHHVGIYLGGGMMIDAPHTGSHVQEESVWLDQFSGAGRY